jgi:hypothetical protein
VVIVTIVNHIALGSESILSLGSTKYTAEEKNKVITASVNMRTGRASKAVVKAPTRRWIF